MGEIPRLIYNRNLNTDRFLKLDIAAIFTLFSKQPEGLRDCL